jgi:hypothetical protein
VRIKPNDHPIAAETLAKKKPAIGPVPVYLAIAKLKRIVAVLQVATAALFFNEFKMSVGVRARRLDTK